MALTLGKENKTQLYFRDDNTFAFIPRQIQYSCLVEKVGDNLHRAWKHFYGCQFPFPGYKNIKSGTVTLGFSRDIILDPFDMVPKGIDASSKPDKTKPNGMKDWIANIAENQRHIFRAKREQSVWVSRVTWAMMAVLGVEVLCWAIIFMVKHLSVVHTVATRH